jgi:hypothetical protein
MSKKLFVLFIVLALFVGLIAGCRTTTAQPTTIVEPTTAVEPTAAAAAAALKITGNVETEMTWSEEEVKAMPTMEAQNTNKAGELSTYTGVSLNSLLDLAKPKSDATGLAFVADDGFTAEVTLAEVRGCADCIVSFRENGGFSTVLPGFAGKLQVKGVVEIQVK